MRGREHHFRLTAYAVTAADEPRRMPILCPYAIGFDVTPTLQAVGGRSRNR